MNTIIFDPFSLTKGSINWTAPELLTPDDTLFQPSVPSDVYALAMVIFEVSIVPSLLVKGLTRDQVLTGATPFGRISKTDLACKVVLENDRPSRPRDSEKLGFSDDIWESLQRCWDKEPSARPSVGNISVCLKRTAETWVVDIPAFMLASEAGIEQMMSMREEQAKVFINELDQVRLASSDRDLQPSGS